jgi:transcriptional regulator with XRE-family HTH domain
LPQIIFSTHSILGVKYNSKIIAKKVGKRIKELRKSNGLTQSQMAFEAGVERSQIARIERGEINTSIYSLFLMAKVLNVHVTELLKDIEMPLE